MGLKEGGNVVQPLFRCQVQELRCCSCLSSSRHSRSITLLLLLLLSWGLQLLLWLLLVVFWHSLQCMLLLWLCCTSTAV
jgi:hypothetical protein